MKYRKPTETEKKIVKEIFMKRYKTEKALLISLISIFIFAILFKVIVDIFYFKTVWETKDWIIHCLSVILLGINAFFFYNKNKKNFDKVQNSDFYTADMTVKDIKFSKPSKTVYVNLEAKDLTPKIYQDAYFETFIGKQKMNYYSECQEDVIKKRLMNKKCSFVSIDHATEYAIILKE